MLRENDVPSDDGWVGHAIIAPLTCIWTIVPTVPSLSLSSGDFVHIVSSDQMC